MKNNILAFPKKTIHKTLAPPPGALLVHLDLRVPAPVALAIIALIDAKPPSSGD